MIQCPKSYWCLTDTSGGSGDDVCPHHWIMDSNQANESMVQFEGWVRLLLLRGAQLLSS